MATETLRTQVIKTHAGEIREYVDTDHWPREMLWDNRVLQVAAENAKRAQGPYQLHGQRLCLLLENGIAEYEIQTPPNEDDVVRGTRRLVFRNGSKIGPVDYTR